jgi:hypothetical protein
MNVRDTIRETEISQIWKRHHNNAYPTKGDWRPMLRVPLWGAKVSPHYAYGNVDEVESIIISKFDSSDVNEDEKSKVVEEYLLLLRKGSSLYAQRYAEGMIR